MQVYMAVARRIFKEPEVNVGSIVLNTPILFAI